MAGDFGSPATANYKAPDGLATISSLMALKQQKQALQSQALEIQGQQQGLQGQAAQVQQEQQTAKQRKALAGVDWLSHTGEDGLIDLTSVAKDPSIREAAGDTYPQLLDTVAKARTAQLQSKQTMLALNNSQIGALGAFLGGLATDSDVVADNAAGRQKVTNAFGQFGQVYGPEATRVAMTFGPVTQHAPPGKLADALKAIQLQANDAGKQLELTKGGGGAVQTAGGIQQINTNPYAAAPMGARMGAPVANATAPQIVTMPSNQMAVVPAGGGTLPNMGGAQHPPTARTGPRTAADDSPGMNAPRAAQEAYQKAVEQENTHVEEVRRADTGTYGQNMLIANRIRDLAGKVNPGQGTKAWHDFLGAIGSVVGANNVSDYQTLSAYLDRQAATLRSTMGLPNTNAGSSESRDISGSVQYQRDAILEKNDLNQALAEGAHQYREGLDRIAGFGGQASPKAVQQFKSEWTKYFDPNVYRAELAAQRGKADAEAFVKSLDPAEARSLKAKRAALSRLSQGQMQ
ncbi:hypothetical protein UFOVP154_45 [uncultured Caudovirales phage]|uniref:Uncharacterized protein n=1 Tax=uncultured Caudovirales phage TaxID=2100421 RepID=A0A6J5KI21_9CAUD|nr:hypothetical protein UFOVP8_30 [uncultured Caudovirales phage]CAB5170740.1 hypothetical protein UFOVP154_45 [uncultured Caudovirales phage]